MNKPNWTKLEDGSFRDNITGLIWLPSEPGVYTHQEALEVQDNTKHLPTREEYEEAKKNGIIDIFDMEKKCYWSSSVYLYNTQFAYYFGGVTGYIYCGNRKDYDSVRCIKRSKE